MGDRLRAGIPPWYVTKPTRSTQPCIPLGLLNRVPALIGWGKGRNVTSVGWQVTLCDPVWHASSRSGVVLVAQTAIRFLTLPYLTYPEGCIGVVMRREWRLMVAWIWRLLTPLSMATQFSFLSNNDVTVARRDVIVWWLAFRSSSLQLHRRPLSIHLICPHRRRHRLQQLELSRLATGHAHRLLLFPPPGGSSKAGIPREQFPSSILVTSISDPRSLRQVQQASIMLLGLV